MSKNSLTNEYNKLYKNLKRQVKSLEKRGYVIPEGFIPTKPKKVTEGSIRRLQKLKEGIYKSGSKIQYKTETGKLVTAGRGREIERETAGKKAYETQTKNKLPFATEKTTTPQVVEEPLDTFDFIKECLQGAMNAARKERKHTSGGYAYNELWTLVDSCKTDAEKGSLEQALNEACATYQCNLTNPEEQIYYDEKDGSVNRLLVSAINKTISLYAKYSKDSNIENDEQAAILEDAAMKEEVNAAIDMIESLDEF